MARVVTKGWDTLDAPASGNQWVIENSGLPNAYVAQAGVTKSDTAHARGGGGCLLVNTVSTYDAIPVPTEVSGTDYYLSFWVRFDANPTAALALLQYGATAAWYVGLNTDGTLYVEDSGFNPQTPGNWTTGHPLSLGVWHNVQIHWKWSGLASGSSTMEWWLDGVQISTRTSANFTATAASVLRIGSVNANAIGGANIYFDDLMMNDSSGTVDNGFPSATSTLAVLRPAADSAVGTGWTTDALAATGLFSPLTSEPPKGRADSSSAQAAPAQQDRNATSTTTSNLDLALQTYIAAGVPDGSTVLGVQAIVGTGASSTTATAGALFIVSNASGTAESAETSFSTFAAAATAGAYPTGWTAKRNTWLHIASQPTLTSAPVMRIGKRTATTRVALVNFAGMVVEYIPPALGVPLLRHRAPVWGSHRPSQRARFMVAFPRLRLPGLWLPASAV